jgi:kynurenine formamidase
LHSTPSEDEVLAYFDTLSNWGRWGENDELGTLNLITPTKRRQAIGTVTEGISVGCARPIRIEPWAADVSMAPVHFMVRTGDPAAQLNSSASDFIGLAPHGLTVSHVDTLSHQFWKGLMYNGRPMTLVSTDQKATVYSVESMSDGIVTRGVLLDIARLRGKEYLEAGEAIFPADLEASERAQGVRLDTGDALLVRTGWYKSRVERGPHPKFRPRPGLHAATLPWLKQRDVALVAGDASEDVNPSGYPNIAVPIHSVGIVAMGLCLIDACQFDDLAVVCERLGRWEFLFVVAPLRFERATASPITPIAIL